MFYKIFSLLLILHILQAADVEEKQHFFYDKAGILNIDGSVPGSSEPITLEADFLPFDCGDQRHFMITFCPDKDVMHDDNLPLPKNKSSPCDEGIAFCYEPILRETYVREEFVLPTFEELDIAKKCGPKFRGFSVALRYLRDLKNRPKLFYEIQLSFKKEPYYFQMPDEICINVWFGGGENLATTVHDTDGNVLNPVQVRASQDSFILKGVTAEEYKNDEWFDYVNMERYGLDAGLKLLYIDFKSLEYRPQMFFTIGPKSRCQLYGRVQNSLKLNVGKCTSQFHQKFAALRSFGKNSTTKYKLTIESGLSTNETTGSKNIVAKILDFEFEETQYDEKEQNDFQKGLQGSSESVEQLSKSTMHTSNTWKEVKDITPIERQIKAAIIGGVQGEV